MNLRAVDLNLLPILDALLIDKSTTLAASRLSMSQSAVSAALSRLRAILGDPLFVRHGQRLVATDFAVSLETPLREILQQVENFLTASSSFDLARATDGFKLSGSDFYAEMLMPKLAAIFARQAPGIQLQQVDLVPDNYVGSLSREGIDLALLPRSDFPEWVVAETAHRSGFVMAARRGHPRIARAGLSHGQVAPVDLVCDLGYVLFSPEGKLKGMGDAALARIGRERRVAMTLPVMNGVLSAVATSDLCAFIPEQIAISRADRLGLDLFHLPFHVPKVEICMIWHRRHTTSPAHQWLRKQVLSVLAEVDAMSLPLPDRPG